MKALTGLILRSGTSQSDTDIRYLSDFTAPDPFLFLRTNNSCYLVVSAMEKGRAERQSKLGTQVYTPGELGLNRRQMTKVERQITALMEKAGLRRIQVPADFPAGLYQALVKRGVAVSVLNKAVCPQRSVKSREELGCLRASQRAAVAAMHGAVSMIAASRIDAQNRLRTGRDFLTSEMVRHHIHKALIEYDCSGFETIVAGGEQATDPHERGSGPLHAGQAVIIDIFPRSEKSGYWGDITRTVCRGSAPSELKRLYQAVKAAQAAALRAVKPGICADDVHASAKAVFEKKGYKTESIKGKNVGFIHGTGHGVGLDIHEKPRIGTSGEILQAGNVITIEPGLYYPDIGGIRIEDTVVVTEKGWRYLAPCEKKFEV